MPAVDRIARGPPGPGDIHARYGDDANLQAMLAGFGPAGRRLRACDPGWPDDAPVLLTEFGGIAYVTNTDSEAWGYSNAVDAAGYEAQLSALVTAVRTSAPLAGFCYTQLTDTRQEANGLCDENRQPKLPVETLRQIFAG